MTTPAGIATHQPLSRNHAEVAIVGAGPAGTAAAITLARAGREVTVVDKARFPRDKICGDGLTTGALRLLEELGLDPAAIPSWREVRDVCVRGPGGREVRFPLPRGQGTFAAVARRVELDDALVQLARDAGATVIEGDACETVELGDDLVDIGLASGTTWSASFAFGADGMWSPLRKRLGLDRPGYRGEWHAFRQYFSNVGPRAASELLVWFEPDFLPGYAWSFPVAGGGANVGFGVRRGGSWQVGQLNHLWRDLLARPHIRAELGPDARTEGPARAWPIPARIGGLPLGRGRVLLVGDAIGATDPMTGEGIGQALATGRWAAEAVLAAGPADPAAAQARFAATVRRELVTDHALSELLVRALQHRRGARLALALAGATPWTRRNFARWLFEDYPRAILVTPGRWHPGMFTAPGAFRPSERC